MKNNKDYREESFSGNKKDFQEDFFILAEKMMADLPQRSAEIIKKRFGIFDGKSRTLDGIGKEYGITRERVRQIIADALRAVKEKTQEDYFKKFETFFIFTINSNGGIIKEVDLIKKLSLDDGRRINTVRFLGQCSAKTICFFEKGRVEKTWATSREVFQKAKEILSLGEKILQSGKEPMTETEFVGLISKQNKDLSSEEIVNFLEISSRVKKNFFGKWGMVDWKEISPKGTREKIYLVLKESGKPLHFLKIAELIDRYKLGSRKAHPQTVHNELIKDDRFVLIGRGIYALSEWGYSEGTIRDVLEDILSKSRKPLPKGEILEKVLKMRKVKKSTIMINLNNTKFFARQNNLYALRKK